MADPGFSKRQAQKEVLTYYLARFSPKTAWKWKKLDPEGRTSLDPPSPDLDPPNPTTTAKVPVGLSRIGTIFRPKVKNFNFYLILLNLLLMIDPVDLLRISEKYFRERNVDIIKSFQY